MPQATRTNAFWLDDARGLAASLLEFWIDEAERRAWFLFEATRAGESADR